MQEQVNDKTVALSVKGVKLTGSLLAKAMQAYLRSQKARASPQNKSNVKVGMQSVKSLTKQGAALTNIEIGGDNIGDFRRIARKYNVDFALKRDKSESPPKWMVFFKSKDADSLTAAFNEYSKIQLKVKKKTKKPMLERLSKFKELAKLFTAPVKNRDRDER